MRTYFLGLVPAICALTIAVPSSSIAADTISAPERCSPKTGCSFSADSYWMSTGETPVLAMPPVLDFPHDVVSTVKAPDGRTLFESEQVGAGKATVVNGTEYLTPGTYHFICSIHNFPTIYGTRMEADLVVVDNGMAPKPRPTIEMTFPRQTMQLVRKKGTVLIAASAPVVTDQVKFVVKLGKKVVATKTNVTLQPGKAKSFELLLYPGVRRELGDRGSAAFSLIGSARFGEPEIARRRVR